MTNEVLEAELAKLSGQTVVVVRPMFGTQSDSWMGELQIMADTCVLYQVKGTLFRVNDITYLDEPKTSGYKKIIRLKGPHDYKEKYEETTNH